MFTSHLAGDHTVCLSTNTTSSWFQGNPTLRIHLDIAIGSIKHDEGEDLNHIQNLTNRVELAFLIKLYLCNLFIYI